MVKTLTKSFQLERNTVYLQTEKNCIKFKNQILT